MSASKLATRTQAVERLIGDSAWTRQIRADILRTAPFRSSVLVTGPTGTGKELIARALHDCSDRQEQPFIPVNCAAAAPHLFASHLFGHEKGAFTGAQYATLGCFRAACGGTVFLDEIGELDLELQAKLLRVLQEKTVVPVGSYEAVPIDTRIISATNRCLEEEVASGKFREDLFYRLNVVTLSTVSLSERDADLPLLADHCLGQIAQENGLPIRHLDPEAEAWMRRYPWPGNVRQLQNVLERAVIYSTDEAIGADELRAAIADPPLLEASDSGRNGCDSNSANSPEGVEEVCRQAADSFQIDERAQKEKWTGEGEWLRLQDLESYHIRQTLQKTFFNQTAAADLLGITYRSLSRKIKRYGIDISRSRRGRPKKQ